MSSTESERGFMEIILAIGVTGIGVFGGICLIWKGHYSSSSKAQHPLIHTVR